MKKLQIYLKEFRKECVLAPFFKLLEAVMDLLVPLVVASVLNKGVADGNTRHIILCVLLMILLAALGLGFSFTAQYYAARAGAGFAANLRQALFDHIGSFTYTDLDRAGTDTLITRLTSDVNLVQNGLNMALRLLLRSPFIVFGSMIMAFTIDVKSALIFAGAIPLLGIVVYGIMIISIPLYRKAQEALDALTMATRENLTGVRVIRAFSKEKEETALFDKRNEALTAMNEFVGRLSALMNPLTYVMINIATILLIRVSGARVNIGAIRQGDVVALYNYMAQMIVELIKLAALLITINKAAASAGRISEVLAIEPGMQYPETLAPSSVRENEAVRFRGVSFSYPDSGAAAVSYERRDDRHYRRNGQRKNDDRQSHPAFL
jgi:ABC-type multidrug transport system fused ATPase/permease subunit